MRNPRTLIGLAVLTVLLGVLGHRVWARGFGLRLGAAKSTLSGPHTTEAQWAVAAVTTDIAEMLQHAVDPRLAPGSVDVDVKPLGAGFEAHVRIGDRRFVLPVDLREGVWSPVTYRPIAARLLGGLGLSPSAPGEADDLAAFTARLLEAGAPALERENERLGTRLGARMVDADLHEAAALLVVAFSLREAAERLSDDRPQLLRILAHLSIAAALRDGKPPAFAGAAAASYADHLAGRDLEASRALSTLAATAEGAQAAWGRVLATRVDEDWRRLPAPRTLVERREHFRARVRAIASTQVIAELASLGAADEADWGRIVRHDLQRVDARGLVTRGLDDERAEILAVWRVTHPAGAAPDVVATLDGARIGAMTPRGPRPLPWGLWSRFFERHLVTFAARIDTFYRHSIGANQQAEAIGRDLDAQLGGLDLYPAATGFRTRGVANGDADLRRIDAAIRVTLRRPEIVPAVVWAWLEFGQQYEPVAKGMPPAVAWFGKPAPRTASLDLAHRLKSVGHNLGGVELDALWQSAPTDYRLAKVILDGRVGVQPTAARVRQLFEPRLDYDVRARRLLADALTSPADRVPVQQGTCALDVESCFAYAWTLVEAGREAEAAVVYQKTIDDERVGAVAMAHNAGWLVEYYRRHGQVARALALANAAADVGSSRGVGARAWLFECLDRLDEAEEDYGYLADRYGDRQQPIGFYYRMARVRKLKQYEARLQAALPALFPSGLQPVAPNDARQAPAAGVQVTKDSPLSRRHGIQSGDLIVALDGWRVESLQQYQAVRAFSTGDRLHMVLWRGARIDVDAEVPNRMFNIDLRSYPIRGWAE